MNPAIYDTVSCDIETDKISILRATGSTIKFPGFLAVYEEREDKGNDEEKAKEDQEKRLASSRKRTNASTARSPIPPIIHTPSSPLYRSLSCQRTRKIGIGRPSTYATIMNKIQSRDYTVKEKGSSNPPSSESDRPDARKQLHHDHGRQLYCAMEDELEHIAENNKNWKELIRDFWDDFIPVVETAEKEAFVPSVMTDLDCPECGHKLQKIWARKKYFYGCSNYPACDFTAPLEAINFNKDDYDPTFDWDQPCPKDAQAP